MRILAIDPGNIESAYCRIATDTLRPIAFGKHENEKIKEYMRTQGALFDKVVIEMVASYRNGSWGYSI